MRDEHGINVPIRTIHPRNMDRAARMTYKHVLHLAAHINEHSFWIGLQKVESFFRGEVLHGRPPNGLCQVAGL